MFDPNTAVTREQFAAMLHRYAHYKGLDVSVGEDTNILSYSDALTTGEWAIPAMQWAVGAGIISGYDNPSGSGVVIASASSVARAVAATMLMRFSALSETAA